MELHVQPSDNVDAQTQSQVEALLHELASRDAHQRWEARNQLSKMGEPVVPLLIQLLGDRSGDMRWEAAATLRHMHDPAATDALITALDDSRRGVRWLAAEGLIAIGRPVVEPLLRALIANPSDYCLLQGAHHVLAAVCGQPEDAPCTAVIKALKGPSPELTVPIAAYHALDALASA